MNVSQIPLTFQDFASPIQRSHARILPTYSHDVLLIHLRAFSHAMLACSIGAYPDSPPATHEHTPQPELADFHCEGASAKNGARSELLRKLCKHHSEIVRDIHTSHTLS
jgi:hypothetical protein